MNEGKSIDEMETLPQVEPVNGPTGDPNQERAMDLRRRRLIRGAVGIAPAVMTLRSGGLAAGSLCVSTSQSGLTLGAGPTGSTGTNWIQVPLTGSASAGDQCIKYTAGGCAGATGFIQKLGATGKGFVTAGPTAGTYFCSTASGGETPVAILSTASATSLALT